MIANKSQKVKNKNRHPGGKDIKKEITLDDSADHSDRQGLFL